MYLAAGPLTSSRVGLRHHHSLPSESEVNEYIHVSGGEDHNCQDCHSQAAVTWRLCSFELQCGFLGFAGDIQVGRKKMALSP